jgi:hypothetical protein
MMVPKGVSTLLKASRFLSLMVLLVGLQLYCPEVAIGQCTTTVDVSIIPCHGGTATVTFVASGGTAPYTYTFNSTNNTTGVFTGITAGLGKAYTITAASGCGPITGTVDVVEPDLLAATLASTNVTCNGSSNGTISITGATGGHGTYEYSISGGSTWQATGNYTGLGPATLNVMIRDAAYPACTLTLNGALVISEPAALAATLSSTNVTCNGLADGTISITGATGGSGTYEYSISGGTTWQSGGSYTGIGPATLNVMIRDAANPTCTLTLNGSLVITQPAPLTATITTQTNVLCYSNSTGAVTVMATAGTGTAPYTYSIDGTTFVASGTFGTLAAGSYTITVKDANGCTTTVPVTITQPTSALAVSITAQTNVLCHGNSTGAVTVVATAGTGTAPYTYSIDGTTFVASGTFGTLAAGSYTITVKDANGCTTTVPVTITQPTSALAASITAQSNVLCHGNSTGAVTVVATAGTGTAPYTYSIDGTTFVASGTFGTLAAGSYTITVKDANGCTTTVPVTITQPTSALAASITAQSNVLCHGNSTGAVTVVATAGTGTAPYTYSIDGTTFVASGTFGTLTAGSYTITVKDANGCTVTVPVTITEPLAALSFGSPAITNVSCAGLNDGTIVISASGGTGIITYSISPNIGTQSPSGTFNNLTAQNYTITATDANGCILTTVVTVATTPDTIDPVISGCPAGVTVATGAGRMTCDQIATWTEPTAIDNCQGAMTFTTRSHAPGSLFPVGSTTVTYTFTDSSGNTSTCSFVVQVDDTTFPTFTVPANVTIYTTPTCTYSALPGITGDVTNEFDNCTPVGLNALYSDVTAGGACAGTFVITRTWTLTDNSSNVTTQYQTITVSDNIKPTLVIPPAKSIQCDESILPANTGLATATDNCGGPVTVVPTDNTVAGTCTGNSTITRTWTATDCSGNISVGTQTIFVSDVTKPEIDAIQHMAVSCPANIPDIDPTVITAHDKCGAVSIVFISEIANGLEGKPGYCPTSLVRTYRVIRWMRQLYRCSSK